MWFFFSSWILLKAIPYQLPLKSYTGANFLHYSLCYFIFIFGLVIAACLTRDRRLLLAYTAYAMIVLLVMMSREREIEHELIDKLRNGLVGFFVMPYWGWSRLLDEKAELWISGWCALSGAVTFFTARFCPKSA